MGRMLRLVERLRLMDGLRLMKGMGQGLLAAVSPLRGSCRRRVDPAELELHQPVHRLKLGGQILEPRIVLTFELFHELVELSFMGVDLLFKQSGPVLQVPANITHCLPLVADVCSNDRAGWQVHARPNELCLAAAPGKYSKVPVMPLPGCLSDAS